QPPTQGYFRIFSAGNLILDGRDPDDPNPSRYYRVADSAQQGDVLQFTVKLRGLRRDQMFLINVNDPGQDPLTTYATLNPAWGRLHRFSFPIHTARLAQPFTIPPSVDPSGSYIPNAPTSVEPPPTYFTTQWADVTYFLRPNNSSTGTQPLFSLYRRQNL